MTRTRIGDSTPVLRTTELAEVPEEQNVCEAPPAQQQSTMPEVQASRRSARPEVAVAGKGEKARTSQLAALQTLGTRLSSDLASNVLRSSDVLDTVHGSLGRASH